MIQLLQSIAGMIFIIAAMSKARHPLDTRPFLIALGFRRVPATIVAHSLPLLEGAIGVLLLASVADLIIGISSSALALAFLTAQIKALHSVAFEHCRCFGALDTGDIATSVFRAAILVASTISVTWLAWSDPDSMGFEPMNLLFGAFIGCGLIVGVGLAVATFRFQRARPLYSGTGSVLFRSEGRMT